MNTVRKELNLRDLGNIEASNGRLIQKECFYRSAGLNTFQEKELEEIKALGLKAILDLRSKEERNRHPDPNIGVPILFYDEFRPMYMDDVDFSWNGMLSIGEKGLEQRVLRVKYYEQLPFNNPYLNKAISLVRDKQTPFLFHCASGKDRTGLMAIVLLALLGVSDDRIIEDYVLSNEYRKCFIDQAYIDHAKLIEEYPELHPIIVETCGVKKEMGEAMIQSIKTRYGDWGTYFQEEFGLDPQERQKLMRYYTK